MGVTASMSGLGRRFQLAGVGLVLVALALAFFARPASAAVNATVSPSTGLGITGTIAVTASGFPSGNLTTVHVLECEHDATDSAQCDANTDDSSVVANAAGNYSNSAYTYYTLPNPNPLFNTSPIICDASHACDLLVIQDDYNNFSNPHVLIPLTFSATAPTTTIAATTTVVAGATTSTVATATTTFVADTTVPAGDATTAVTGTTVASGATSTTRKGGATTVAGQGGGDTLPTDPSVGPSSGDTSGGQLPFTGPPTAAPIVAVCGIVILFAGTLMRRVVLRVPDSGVSLS